MNTIINEYNLDDMIIIFLSNRLSSEHNRLILKVLKCFSSYDYFDYEADMFNIISIADNVDMDEFPHLIYDVLIKHMKVLLTSIGIILENDIIVDTANLNGLYKILNGIVMLGDRSNIEQEDILQILSSEGTSLDIFTDLFTRYTEVIEQDILLYVDDVTNKLIRTITTIVKENVVKENEEEDTGVVNKCFTIINNLLSIGDGYISLGAKILTTNAVEDMNLEELIKNYIDDLNNDINKKGLDVLSLIAISDKDNDDYLETYVHYFEQLVDDDTVFGKFKEHLYAYNEVKG